eukprot:TRINITY_DN10646_c0_g1_i9.p1 TRINITY_DN10646_c0_g1~~TRINITY_DN10646_c0_g1_i9.p1  ORF type:complete len:356 (+),score=62.67 TRINITY_DN10646_c0_g1_i9:584-1651(+)
MWYFVVSNCNGTDSDAEVTVHLHLINKGGWWKREFSINEQGILELYVVVVPLFGFLAVTFLSLVAWNWKRGEGKVKEIPAIIKWFIIIVALYLVGWVQKLVAYISIASTGYGEPNGYGTDAVARVMLLQLVCNFSTGFRVLGESFRRMKPSADCKVICVGGVVLLVVYFWMHISNPQLSDDRPRSTSSVYQTVPAIIAGCLALPIACYFCRNVWRQAAVHSEARSFFLWWGVVLLVYIISLPVGLVVDYSPALTRLRNVECAVLISDLFGCIACGLLLRPRPWLSRVLRLEFSSPDEEPNYMLMMSAGELSDSPTTIPATGQVSSDMLLTPMCSILSGSHLSGGVKEEPGDEVEL